MSAPRSNRSPAAEYLAAGLIVGLGLVGLLDTIANLAVQIING